MRNILMSVSCLIIAFTAATVTMQEVREQTGIADAWKEHFQGKTLTGEGVSIGVYDSFDRNDIKVSHGEMVEEAAKLVAPNATFVRVKTTQRIDGGQVQKYPPLSVSPFVANLSNRKIALSNLDVWDGDNSIKNLAKKGALVVLSAGNFNEFLGANAFTKSRAKGIEAINNDPTIDGAVILVGDGNLVKSYDDIADANISPLSVYSSIAGASRNHFIYVPSAGVVLMNEASNVNATFMKAQGTSFATPIVSGTAALLMQRFPKASAKQIAILLLHSAKPMEYVVKHQRYVNALARKLVLSMGHNVAYWQHYIKSHWHDVFGRGMLDVMSALRLGKQYTKSNQWPGLEIWPSVNNGKLLSDLGYANKSFDSTAALEKSSQIFEEKYRILYDQSLVRRGDKTSREIKSYLTNLLLDTDGPQRFERVFKLIHLFTLNQDYISAFNEYLLAIQNFKLPITRGAEKYRIIAKQGLSTFFNHLFETKGRSAAKNYVVYLIRSLKNEPLLASLQQSSEVVVFLKRIVAEKFDADFAQDIEDLFDSDEIM